MTPVRRTTVSRARATVSPARQLAAFIARYDPAIAREGRKALATLQRLVPGAVRLVYDNYNFLVVGFGPSGRASEAVISLAFAPKWLALCFLQNGPGLPDPHKLLRGSGTKVRNVRLASATDLDTPAVRALLREALRTAVVPIDPRRKGQLVIRSVSARQRPRRPS